MSTHSLQDNHCAVPPTFTTSLSAIDQGNEAFPHFSLPLLKGSLPSVQSCQLPSPAGNRPILISPLVHQATLMRPCTGDIWGTVTLNSPTFTPLELSQLHTLPPEQSTRPPMLPSQQFFGIWVHVSANSQSYPSTSLESLACKNRGNTVTDIFRKGMHM